MPYSPGRCAHFFLLFVHFATFKWGNINTMYEKDSQTDASHEGISG